MGWELIIGKILESLLAKCFEQLSGGSPKAYLLSHYDAETGKMDSDFVEDNMRQTYRAIRKAHNKSRGDERRNFPRYTDDEVYAMTEKKLLEGVNAPEAQLLAAVSGVAADATIND